MTKQAGGTARSGSAGLYDLVWAHIGMETSRSVLAPSRTLLKRAPGAEALPGGIGDPPSVPCALAALRLNGFVIGIADRAIFVRGQDGAKCFLHFPVDTSRFATFRQSTPSSMPRGWMSENYLFSSEGRSVFS